MDNPNIWVLLYSRRGDNSQALALAESLGRPFQIKQLKYNWLRRFGLRFGPTFITLARESREQLRPPWPDIVISIGRWSVPVSRAIKAESRGRTRSVFLGNPRVDPGHFDLVFATPDYLQPRGPNVVVTPMPMAVPVDTPADADWAATLPSPRTLLLVGAPIKYWDLTPARIASTVSSLAERSNAAGGSLMVSGSPRTPDALLVAASESLIAARYGWMSSSRSGGMAAMVAAADELIVTGDSMSMATEAILTGKPVGIVPLDLSRKGRRRLGNAPAEERSGSKRRDMRRFWARLWDNDIAGTVRNPRAAAVNSSAAAAALLVAAQLTVADVPAVVEKEMATASPITLAARSLFSVWAGFMALADNTQRDAGALWLATWDSQTPWYVKIIAGLTSVSAMSPVDLTPDVVPVVGFMDDLLLLTIGTVLTARLIPTSQWTRLRDQAISTDFKKARLGMLAVFSIWLATAMATLLRGSGLM